MVLVWSLILVLLAAIGIFAGGTASGFTGGVSLDTIRGASTGGLFLVGGMLFLGGGIQHLRFDEDIEQLFKQLKIDFVNIATDQSYIEAIVQLFRKRAHRY